MLIPKFDLYKSEWLDLVFENRNKNYGAYELRQHYSQTMAKAMAFTLLGFVSVAITMAVITRLNAKPDEIVHIIHLSDPKVILPPPPKKIDEPLQPPPAKAAPVKPLQATPSGPSVVIPTHVTTEPVTTDPPTMAQISQSTISSEASKGTGPAVQPIAEGTGNGTGTGDKVDNDTGIRDFAEVSPEPMGGMAGWSKFIQRNLRYPDTDAQGRVFVSFVVERDGSLSNIKILKGVSPELDAEALRVIRMAPKWKPGMQGGQAVRVQFNIPINFQQNN
ncbi:energy transducer TonB [Mucilaginibacter jinjuensis]|uniref:TonB family protein n=1 Tax=Mucilaginibacter jinjuensis TaxID=1176721 RepID=A0ABY7T228_9SPHI|nr:energy transducer TonB [Mucilaginibacter jinjuensis]WCT10499.1 TonB family protein [Mucilaginibacter jinjuensis]